MKRVGPKINDTQPRVNVFEQFRVCRLNRIARVRWNLLQQKPSLCGWDLSRAKVGIPRHACLVG